MRYDIFNRRIFSLLGALFVIHVTEATKSTASIGVISHPDDEVLAKTLNERLYDIAFKRPQSHLNVISINATSSKDSLKKDNLEKIACAIAIFDLSFGDHHSFALSDVLNIPLFTLKPISGDSPYEFAYSVLPSYDTFARAIVDIIDFSIGSDRTPTEQLTIVAEEEFARVSMKIFSLAREMEKFEVDAIPQLKMNDEENFRHAMEVLPKAGANYVLVLSKPENLAKILEKAIHLGAINKKSRWFALDMDFKGNISKKCFKGLVGVKVNLTHQGREQERKKTPEIILALLNDTLHAIAEAFRKGESKIVKGNGSCFDAKKSSLESGREMLKNLNQVKFNGRTGLVRFDNKTKSRMVQRLDIVNVQVEEGEDEITRSVLKNVGHWDPSTRENVNNNKKNKPVQLNYLKAIDWTGEFWQELQCSVKTKKGKAKQLQGRKITVVTIEDSPFCQKKPNQTKPSERGHGYEGFSIDLLERIQNLTGFEYELKISKEGKMNSLITDLVNKKAHVAIGAITITATRELKVDFSKPFMDFKISLLMQKSTEEELNLFAFLLPFEIMVWLSTIAVVIGVTFLIYCLDYFSPNGYRATAIASGEGEGDEFNLFNSLWFAAGSILQQGADNTPKCASGRILAGAFWFFTMILISTYTANLAAYFTAKNAKTSINSLEDLANQNKIKYGVLNGGSLSTFFKDSQVETYQKMYGTMNKENTFVNSTKEGVARVRQGGFAYLTDEPYLNYYNQKSPCNTMMLKNLLEAKSYGIGLQRRSDLTNPFSVAILKLRESGEVKKLREKWWTHRSDCPDPKLPAAVTTMRISLDHMAGVFIVLAGGILVSIVFLVIERRCHNLRKEVKNSGSMMSVRDQMDQPTVSTAPVHFSRPFSMESKAMNNMDQHRKGDSRDGPGSRANDNLTIPNRNPRLPNVYAGAQESNL
ncbi:glutamate receptor 4-like isoform X1 [Acropora palmata]|uniref:glutamate receptor 4-like isoform X1 n=1 Tax=Acropora palmata TaxID=6131 RepID=UPI003DA0CACF